MIGAGCRMHLACGELFRETCPEHWSFAFRLLFSRFILNDVPMLDKDSVLNAENICCNPVDGQAEVRESSVGDYKVSVGYDRSWLVLEGWRKALDEIEQAFAARLDVSAVLNVVRRPKLLSCSVVALVEQSVESFQNKSFILRFHLLT